MEYGIDYDLNVMNILNVSNPDNPINRTATITLYRDMRYLDWKMWYESVFKYELILLGVEALTIQRYSSRLYASGIKFAIDKNGKLTKIIGVSKRKII